VHGTVSAPHLVGICVSGLVGFPTCLVSPPSFARIWSAGKTSSSWSSSRDSLAAHHDIVQDFQTKTSWMQAQPHRVAKMPMLMSNSNGAEIDLHHLLLDELHLHLILSTFSLAVAVVFVRFALSVCACLTSFSMSNSACFRCLNRELEVDNRARFVLCVPARRLMNEPRFCSESAPNCFSLIKNLSCRSGCLSSGKFGGCGLECQISQHAATVFSSRPWPCQECC